ncbi:glycoside hydrolase family 97 protein [Gaoshiqia sp. Z1-71]|uniref:glycoside hydrolase family 97 protein n=1 Tax=Gaoshiqia hydrogeniformans TaxID=3290090 RepID=UPI003BF8E3EF
MIKKLLFPAILLAVCIACQPKTEPLVYELTSPNGANKIQFELKNGQPGYSVSQSDLQILFLSKLGFVFCNQDSLYSGLEIKDMQTSSFNETWEQVWGEKHFIRNHYNQLSVTLQEKTGKKRRFEIQFRAFDDGIAFRYVYPEQAGSDSLFIFDELTEFNLKDDGNAWWIPAYRDNRYEYLFTKSPVSELDTVHTPLSIESDNGLFLSLHEADLVDYASMTLAHTSGTKLKCDLVPWSDGVKVKTKAPFQTPWRTLQIGRTPGDLVTSYLILNLNEPNKLEDTSWIRPSKYMGIWWGMHIGKYTFWESPKQGATTENAKEYIDFAAKNGIDRLLIEGWNKGWTPQWYENAMHMFSFTECADGFDIEKVVEYGNSKGVKLIGYHETGSNLINYLDQIDEGMALYRKLGMHDIKIGQVGSRLNMKEWHHGQFGVNYYRYVLEKAAEHQLAVNFHEPIKDTGERRAYPNMMAREGARGQEYDAWSEGNPPSHMCILPFTRLLAGPMDFTPGIFDVDTKQGYGRKVHSTVAKQLSYYVILYSPIQMLADLPSNYEGKPEFKFLLDVPVDWEDTNVLNGEIGEYITVARKDRHSDNWFLGSMTNEEARQLPVSLSFLDEGAEYTATIYADAPGTGYEHKPMAVEITVQTVQSTDTLQLSLGEGGGCAISFMKK